MTKNIKEKKNKASKQSAGSSAQTDLFPRRIVAALDIGSSKISCFIAEVKNHGGIEVLGIGHQGARGVKAGAIVDLRAAEIAIAHTVEAAENMARQYLNGHPIQSVVVGVPGTQTLSHQLTVALKLHGREVTERDIDSARSHARGVEQAGRDELIHVITSGFSIDKQKGIQEPRGMTGEGMDVFLSPVTAYSAALRNINNVLHHNRLDVDAYCALPYAAGLAALVDDEKDLGCTVIDMGGGTTNIGVFAQGKMVYSTAVPVGGQHVTSDIARGLTTSIADAERIKTLYGAAQSSLVDDGTMIDVPPIGEEEHAAPNYVPKSLLTGIIQPRIEETFELVRAKLVDSGAQTVAGRRVVLTGGAAQLPGLCEIGQLILDKQIRIGKPVRVRGLAESTAGPAFSACAGLLHYAAEHGDEIPVFNEASGFNLPMLFSGDALKKVTHWLKENW